MNAKDIISKHVPRFKSPPTGTPSDGSIDAPLMGNGDMLVALGGNEKDLAFHLSKNDLWRLEHGYRKSSPVTLGSLKISFHGWQGAEYLAEQDLYSATTQLNLTKRDSTLSVKTYVSACANLLIVELATTSSRVNGSVALEVMGGRGSKTESNSSEGIFWGSREFTKGVDIASGAAVAFSMTNPGVLCEDGSFYLTPEKSCTLMLSMASRFDGENFLELAKKGLNQDSEIRPAHELWWSTYWNKSFISIPDSVIEKNYYLSLYSLGSCSRNLSFPPNIFGWVTTDNPLWNGDYHLNYNHQAPFYGLARANRLEQADPHDLPFLDFMGRANWHCKEIFKHEGGVFPVGIGPKGIETTYDAESFYGHPDDCYENRGYFFNQRSNGAYGLVNMAPRWYTTLDEAYGQRIYPFVHQIATFWQHYLTWDKKGKRYIIENDSCHEGSPIEEMNSCVSLALCRLTFQLAIDLTNSLGIKEECLDQWHHILTHLSKPPTHELEGKTVFSYTERNGRSWWKNNTIGIQPIFPAGQVDLDSDPEDLQVAKNTIEVMSRWHDFNGSNSFFPAAVRIGHNPHQILKELNLYCENTHPNGFQRGNPHGIENLSTTHNTINEMLCMGHSNVIRLFPVWPKELDTSFHQIRCHGAFLVSARLEDQTIKDIKIQSEKGSQCNLNNPWPDSPVILIREGQQDTIMDSETISFPTQVNESIEIKKWTDTKLK